MNVVNWCVAHYAEIVAALGGIIIAARIIVKLTPTPKDDTVLESIVSFLKHVGLQIKE